MNKEELNLDDELSEALSKKLKLSKQSLQEYLSFLVKKDLDTVINLNKNYFFDKYTNRLYRKTYKEEILCSKTEINILKLLIESKGGVVFKEDIIKHAWDDRKETSIYTLRNMIKKLRDRTYYEFIKSHSGRGYSLDFPK